MFTFAQNALYVRFGEQIKRLPEVYIPLVRSLPEVYIPLVRSLHPLIRGLHQIRGLRLFN